LVRLIWRCVCQGLGSYFVCPSYQHGQCTQSYQPVDLVEAAIEAHNAHVTLTDAERDEIRETVTHDLSDRATIAQQEIDRCQHVLHEIKEQERKLLHMHYEDRITSELFDDEQTRLRHRRQDAETLVARLNLGYQDIAATLDLALEIISEDLPDLYQRADNPIRRLINQAIFNALYVCDETITNVELTGPFAALRELRDTIHSGTTPYPVPATVASTPPQDAKSPGPGWERGLLDAGSISEVLVEPTDLKSNRVARLYGGRMALDDAE
jgi:hypothetical protein